MNSKTILLVEDNPSDVDLTKRALDKGGIRSKVVVAEDGQEALDYLESGYESSAPNPLPALVLLDLKLPKISGLGVLRRIRSDGRMRRLPVVILTSSKEESDLIAGYDLGANSYIRKPVDFAEFTRTIEQIGLYWLVLNEPPPTGRGTSHE